MSIEPLVSKPSATQVDFKTLRIIRQTENTNNVHTSIQNNDPIAFKTFINENALDRTLQYLNISFESLWEETRNAPENYNKLLSLYMAKNATRQGSLDEIVQLETCNKTAGTCGVQITKLPNNAIRPSKNGYIYSSADIKKNKIQKDCCLKSFDGELTGKMKGYISAKVSYGNGGHQDNVFEEMDTLAEWWTTYKKDSHEFLILLIDTDLDQKFTRIQEKYKEQKNIMVYNHIEFQNYIIDTYYCDNM